MSSWPRQRDTTTTLPPTSREGELSPAASLYDPKSGRKMEVYTDLPGMQLYCGNYIHPNVVGKGGFLYQPRYGVCFETQYYPNAINIPSFFSPSPRRGREENYHHLPVLYRLKDFGHPSRMAICVGNVSVGSAGTDRSLTLVPVGPVTIRPSV